MPDQTQESRASHLKALAIATTRYHEAAPDGIEVARIQYEEALYQFKIAHEQTAGGEVMHHRVRTAGGSEA